MWYLVVVSVSVLPDNDGVHVPYCVVEFGLEFELGTGPVRNPWHFLIRGFCHYFRRHNCIQ